MKKIVLLAFVVFFGLAASVQAATLLPLWDYDPAGFTVVDNSGAGDTYNAAYFGYSGADYSGYYLGTIAGNTDPGYFVSIIETYYNRLTGMSLTIMASYKADPVPGTDGPLTVTAAADGKSGTWSLSVASGYELGFYAVKGGNDFALYYVDPTQREGIWTTRHLLVGSDNNPEISHFSAAPTTTTVVPEPSTAMLLGLGLLGLGAVARRRR